MANCINCGTMLEGPYCFQCGQKCFSDKDKSIRSLFAEFFHFVTHFEGKFLTTIKSIFLHPGQMSLDFEKGVRQKYYKPVSLYLLVVIIYLLFPMFEGLNMKMKYYKTAPVVGSVFTYQIDKKLQKETSQKLTSPKHSGISQLPLQNFYFSC